MSGVLALAFVFSLSLRAPAQTIREICTLSSELPESSGLLVLDDNTFLSHNDGGDKAQLYVFDSTGTINRRVFVKNATNVDWEDMTMGTDGRIFVGGFGNNGNARSDLGIYILPPYGLWLTDTVNAVKISFSYGDQTAFPPSSKDMVYDCEALIFWNDSLHVFTKNWSSPFTGYSKRYVMPSVAGNYQLFPRDSVYLGGIREISWVTSADVLDSTLYLLGSAYIWAFDIDEGIQLSTHRRIELNHFSQKEAISVWQGRGYVTDESTGGYGNLYEVNLADQNLSIKGKKLDPIQIQVHGYSVRIKSESTQMSKLTIYDCLGRQLYTSIIENNWFEFECEQGLRGQMIWLEIELENNELRTSKLYIHNDR